jgi:tetratricopeptide (TPR) repeat protein
MLQPPSIHSRIRLVGSLVELGRFAEAREVAECALEIARTLDHPRARSFAAATLGYLELKMGKPDVAIALLRPALEAIHDLDAALWFPHIAASLCYAYALTGRTGPTVQARAPGEGAHLGSARRVLPAGTSRHDRLFRRNGCASPREGPAQRLHQGRPVELEAARQMMQVEEVLDPAVAVAEHDDSSAGEGYRAPRGRPA